MIELLYALIAHTTMLWSSWFNELTSAALIVLLVHQPIKLELVQRLLVISFIDIPWITDACSQEGQICNDHTSYACVLVIVINEHTGDVLSEGYLYIDIQCPWVHDYIYYLRDWIALIAKVNEHIIDCIYYPLSEDLPTYWLHCVWQCLE